MRPIKLIAPLALIVLGAVVLTSVVSAYSLSGRKWPTNSVLFYMNPSNPHVSASSAEAAMKFALGVWNTQGASSFSYAYGGRVSDTSTGYDGRNVALFRDTSNPNNPGHVATTYTWYSGGTLMDADIVFWAGAYTFFTGTSGCSKGAYVEDFATHELGHALGLSHSNLSDATMYSTTGWCSQNWRTLHADDIAGVQALYGASGGSAETNTAPTVSISTPKGGETFTQGVSVGFAGSASDAEDGDLTARLVWTSSLEGTIGSGGSFTRVLSVTGTHVITAGVTDSGGLSASRQVTITVEAAVLNTAPVVSISSPTDGTSFSEGTSVTFSGSAVDEQDGNLTKGLAWVSSLDGALGKGSGFSRVLSPGTHVIAASVTDSGGLTGAAQVIVTVTASAASVGGPILSATGYKVRGLQKVDLRWSGFDASRIDVYRNGTRVATVSNSGFVTDHVDGRGGGSYRYTVCAAGTATCSNESNVSF